MGWEEGGVDELFGVGSEGKVQSRSHMETQQL